MRIKNLLLIMAFTVLAQAENYTFYDLQNFLNSKYGVTIIADADIIDDFVIYSDDIEKSLTLKNLEKVITLRGYKYFSDQNVVYISKKSKLEEDLIKQDAMFISKQKQQKETKALDRKQKELDKDIFFYKEIVTDYSMVQVNSICKIKGYVCSFIGDGVYFMKNKNEDIDISLFNNNNIVKTYALMGTIYELNKNKLEDYHINVNAFVSQILSHNWLDVSITAEYGNNHQGLQNLDKVSLSTLFQYFQEDGISTVISKPYLVLTDNTETKFTSGQSLTVAGEVITNTERATTQTSYKTIDVGLTINVKPMYSNNYVYVDLSMDISSLIDYDKIKNIANISQRTIKGTYRLTPGHVIKLVGFESSFINEKIFKIPILSDIPLIGGLFMSNYEDQKNTLLVISFELIEV